MLSSEHSTLIQKKRQEDLEQEFNEISYIELVYRCILYLSATTCYMNKSYIYHYEPYAMIRVCYTNPINKGLLVSSLVATLWKKE